MSAAPMDLVDVELRGFPIAVYRRAQEHSDGLMREFSLIVASETSDAVPGRLLTLAERLQQEYGGYSAGLDEQLEAAASAGAESIDVRMTVPVAVRAAVDELGALLAEADEYCASGDLLSLVPPAEVLQFRTWYLGEFTRQIDGEPPRAWAEFFATSSSAG